mgnify:CR=1 FL=1
MELNLVWFSLINKTKRKTARAISIIAIFPHLDLGSPSPSKIEIGFLGNENLKNWSDFLLSWNLSDRTYTLFLRTWNKRNIKMNVLMTKSYVWGDQALVGALISPESRVWVHRSRRLSSRSREWGEWDPVQTKPASGTLLASLWLRQRPSQQGLSTFLPDITKTELSVIGGAGRGFKLWRWYQRRSLKVRESSLPQSG